MVTTDLVNSYFKEVQAININHPKEETDRQEQLCLIERFQGEDAADRPLQELLKGEHAFYRGQYKIALKHYLAGKEIPQCQFCCLRASAFVLEQQGKQNKAIAYAKKALTIRPDDVVTLHLLGKILPAIGPGEGSQNLEETVAKLAENIKEKDQESTEIMGTVPLGGEEIDALSGMFQDGTTAKESSQEEPTTYELPSEQLEKVIGRRMEPAMETDTPVLTSAAEGEHNTPSHSNNSKVSNDSSSLERLNSLANSSYEVKTKATDDYLSTMGVGLDTEDGLQRKIESFQESRRDLVAEYTRACHNKTTTNDNALYVLSGWDQQDTSSTTIGQELLAASCRKAAGGFYLRWNGTGVAINPGPDFLRNFHDAGLHVKDIDCVIVTRTENDAHTDIHAIYQLNYQLNLTASTDDLHIIRYYLNQQAHRDLAATLKPNFKQERNTVHSLELYVDSPDVEKVELTDTLCLNYFPATSPDNEANKNSNEPTPSCLGIRMDCKASDNSGCSATIGHVSGTAWSPMLAHNLGRCDVLIAGFHNTSSKDYRKVKYNDDTLGYFGCYSLMEEVSPRVMLCCEFDGKEGDVRLEVTKKMRQEYAYSNQHGTSILPGDTGLYLDLKTMQVRCSVSNALTDPAKLRIVKGNSRFGGLQYLSPDCVI